MGTAPRTTIHLIRHADAAPELDAEIDAAATYDAFGLNARGTAQAAALARRLAAGRTRPAAVYASPARRARETAGALAAALGVEVEVDDGLREMYLGELTAGDAPPADRARAIRARLDGLAAIAQRDGSWRAVPDAEPAAHVRVRMAAAVDGVIARHRGSHVALVSHAGTINAYIAGIIGSARDYFFLAGNTSITSVAFADDGPMLIRLNDTAHLEPALVTRGDAAATRS